MTEQNLPPTAFILYGATGDLARRLVLPGFYELALNGLLPQDWRLIGNGRGDVSHQEFRNRIKSALDEFGTKPEGKAWDDFADKCFFAGQGFDKDNAGTLLDVLKETTKGFDGTQLVHYFAVPPTNFAKLTEGVKAHGLVENSRVVFEKPYGTSPESFRELDALVQSVFDEEQVYRIDHFLGKEATQNLHVMRFANTMFEGVWNKDFIESVQVDIPETLDVADRADFYDNTGAFLDMIVTHLFQIVAEVAMEPPAGTSSDDLQTARESIMAAFRPLDPADVILGQFNGYRDIEGIADDSTTDTYVAARMWVDTDRWQGVPFLLRTGKRLAESHQRVSIVFKKPRTPMHHLPDNGNVLTFVLSGTGAVEFSALVKKPGTEVVTESASMKLGLASMGGLSLKAYGRLIHDVLAADRSLFTRPDGLEHAWSAVEPVLNNRPELVVYEPDTWGPKEGTDIAGPQGWILGAK